MDFLDQLMALASRVSKQVDRLATEEATKNALVMPFINALGYNVFDPTEVTPELTADVGVKKGEKVDYAILKDGQVIMLFECKAVNANLDRITPSQLYRYFSVTQARIGVLTNGLIYRFFSDLDAPNKMDSRPFLEFNLLDIQDAVVPELKKLTKSHFDQNAIIEAASDLKYTREIKRLLAEQLNDPSEELVRLFISAVYSGRVTQAVKDQFKPLVQKAFRLFVNEQISDRLKSALASTEESAEPMARDAGTLGDAKSSGSSEVATTDEELEAFHTVKAILRQRISADRIAPRDVKSYFGVLLDDNNRKPLCRFYFNTSQKYVGLFDRGKAQEARVPIDSIDDIYSLADRLVGTLALYADEEEVTS
ncbi:MAG: type I restriction endonuclease [Gemmatimonadota bacterium]